MAEFTANIPGPSQVTGEYPIHESGASVVGGALGGFAKILDVGLKGVEERKSEQLSKEAGERLAPVTKQTSDPVLANGQNIFNDLPTLQKMQGMDRIGEISQINRVAPKNMSTAERMARASQITQQMISENPRYASEIREKVQQILGLNPSETLLKTQIEDERSLRLQQQEFQQRETEQAMAHGIAPKMNPDGSIDHTYMAAQLAKVTAADRKLETDLKQSEIDRNEAERRRIDQGTPKNETAEQRKARVQKPLLTASSIFYDAQLSSYLNPMIKALDTITAHPGGPANPQAEQGLRNNAIMALSRAKTAFDQQFQGYRDRAMSSGLDITATDITEVKSIYEAQFKDLMDTFKDAPMAVMEAKIRAVEALKATDQMDFHTTYQGVGRLLSIFGPNMLLPYVNKTLDEAEGLQGKHPIKNAVLGTLNGVAGVASGDTSHIPDKASANILVGLSKQLGLNAAILGPEDKKVYGNITPALIEKGLEYSDPDQLQAVVQATSTAANMATFDKYRADPLHMDQAIILGSALVTLNERFINTSIDQLKPVTGMSSLTFTPVYNPSAGRIEVYVTDARGAVVNPNLTGIPGYTDNGLPAAMIARVNALNQSTAAIAHLKDMSDTNDWSDLQIKQKLTERLPIKAGMTRLELPSDKKLADGSVTKAPAKEQKQDDPLGIGL